MILAPIGSPVVSTAEPSSIEIVRDRWGVPHIYAQSLGDAAFGLAWAQAEDGIEPILRRVMQARAHAAKALGPSFVEDDYRLRMFRIPEIGARLYRSMSPEARAMVDGYADGINLYLELHPKERPPWFDRVSGADVITGIKWYESLQHMAVVRQDMDSIPQTRRDTDQAGGASNSWAVGPSRTADGSVVLLADPHLPWDGLTKWYEFQVVVGERWLYGVSFSGSPLFGLGFNPDVAWASTNNGADTADVYRVKLNPENPDQYLFEGDWRDIESERIEIEIKGKAKLTRNSRRTHHGPIVREDRAAGLAYAVRIAGLETTNLAELAPRYFEAQSVRDIHRSNSGGDHFKWNRIAADRHGDISYFFFAATHERKDGYDWRKPVDGSTRATEWGPRIPWDRLPTTTNPSSGFVMNCNNNPYTVTTDCPIKPEAYPKHLADWNTTLRPNSRAFRATELISAKPKLGFADLERISMDVKAVDAPNFVNAILRAHAEAGDPDDEQQARAVGILRAWDGHATTDNLALAILSTFVEVVGASPPRNPTAQQVLAALSRALDLMKRRWGSIEVPWGEVHVIRRGGREWPAAGAGSQRSAIPFVTLYMTGANRLEQGRSVVDRGSSWMMLVRYHDGGAEAKTILPWGNSQRPDSKHFADQAPLFATRQYKAALLSRAKVEAHAESKIVLRRNR
jgi:penicillin amidase/acyl-homoserine-lactone acylase